MEPIVYSEANTPGLFILERSTLDCRAGVEEISIVTLMPDDYVCRDIGDPEDWTDDTANGQPEDPRINEGDNPYGGPDDPADPDDRDDGDDPWWDEQDYYDRDYE